MMQQEILSSFLFIIVMRVLSMLVAMVVDGDSFKGFKLGQGGKCVNASHLLCMGNSLLY